MLKIHRRPGTQDISWFLDQYRLGRLDLDPPYQRRSVWTPRDRRYFLDTLFRGYPCPPIYLHKTIDNTGSAIFHVVDGKQRIETLIRFSENKIRVPNEYGDIRLDNKRWKDVVSDTEIRNRFLNYPFVVEYFDDVDSSIVNEIFERMNKNSRKLTQQELRNARYDGWFSQEVDREVDEPIWRKIGIVTTGRARRMADVQFLAELFMVLIDGKIVGFDHDLIDGAYARYEEPNDPDLEFDTEEFKRHLGEARDLLTSIYELNPEIKSYISSVSNMYILWAVLTIDRLRLPDDAELGTRYIKFMQEVYAISEHKKRNSLNAGEIGAAAPSFSQEALEYFDANQSATTELPQRTARLNALRRVFKIED